MWTCDKCGQPVEQKNDSLALHFIFETGRVPDAFNRSNHGARHLLPTEDCEGSPSRAQYIEGQPRDTRGYLYIVESEENWREAYARLQELS